MAKAAAAKHWKNRIVGQGEQPADQFMANSANFRRHPNTQRDAMRGALSEIGWIQRVVVNRRTGNLIDGHLRIEEALSKGDKTPVPYIEVDLSKREEKLALAILDPMSAMAVSDKEALDLLLQEVSTGDAGLQAMLAGLAADNGLYFGDEPKAVEDDGVAGELIDRAAELQKKWHVKRGQIWSIGKHRLMCGDSTDAADVERLMAGEKADAVVTDPPYGVGVEYETFDDTKENATLTAVDFMPLVLAMGCPVALTPGVPVMWSYPQPAWVMCWIHPAPVGGCAWGFAGVNPILVYGKDPYLANGLGRHPDHIVMAADREGVEGHPTPKPPKVWTWLVERLSVNEGDLIYEPFAGSGTTLVACENLSRKCFAVEISEQYCAVILERMTLAFPTLRIALVGDKQKQVYA